MVMEDEEGHPRVTAVSRGFAPESDGEGDATADKIARLEAQVEQLGQMCLDTREELRSHRQELLAHREVFSQCLELREGVQAVLREMGDRSSELDLSLAGVSDNTARHGKAISTLTEQQKCTTATLDAVVRAVKRLDRSRSRSRAGSCGSVGFSSAGATAAQGYDLARRSNGVSATSSGAVPFSEVVANAASAGEEAAPVSDDASSAHATLRPGEPVLGAPGDGAGPVGDGLAEFDTARTGPAVADMGDDAWGWPGAGGGWSAPGAEEDDGLLVCQTGDHEEPRYASGASSCGSDARAWRHHQGGKPQQPRPSMEGPGPGRTSGGSAEWASCVNGVMARIEEALTHLNDGAATAGMVEMGEGGCGGVDRTRTRPTAGPRWRPSSVGRTGPPTARGVGAYAVGGTPRRVSARPRSCGIAAGGYGRPREIWRTADSWG
eukprot:TRINITY_DN18723_c0_g2_i1.p1 TRINITY_DN18723_c0_g2~~TRINITY_DN18723_c0_g2_i1.p1  ORF type:complete len:436 (-),score=84.58 TRINITY_DN18723_c0_g2_i1:235-1542(-)